MSLAVLLAIIVVTQALGQTPVSSETPSPSPAPASSSPPSQPSPSKAAHKRRRPKARSVGAPRKVVVKNGSTSDPTPQFSTTVSPEQASREKQNTAGLLASANANLQKLMVRPLNPSQQDASAQVRSYMQQAKTAEDAGDLQSAHNLAVKAVLLSKELVRK
jgi:hypothetical protein